MPDRASATIQRRRREPLALRLLRLGFRSLGNLFPGLAADYLYRIWFRTQRHPVPAAEIAIRETADFRRIAFGEQQIATWHWGERGPLVLLLHGWSGRGTQLAHLVAPLLAAGYQVLALDAPAHGESDGDATTIFEIADCLLLLRDTFGDFHGVICHSFGTPATLVAHHRGLRYQWFIGISPPATLEFLIDKFTIALQVPERVVLNFQARLRERFDADLWQQVSAVENARQQTVPALFIHDVEDRDVGPEQSQAIFDAWPGARLELTRHLGHVRILRDPQVIQRVARFAAQHHPSAAPAQNPAP